MGLASLLFGFKGRINRAQYWLGSLGVGFGAVILIFAAGLAAAPQQGVSKEAALAAAPMMLLMMGVVCLLSGWCGLALQVKRFHDRNQPGWLSLLPALPVMGLMITLAGGVFSGQTPMELAASVQPYMLVLWAINIFMFINLGCLSGTDGANKYGDPPGSPRSPSSDPSPFARPQAHAPSVALGSVEAAMARAIAEQSRQPAAPVRTARPAVAAASAAPMGGGASFGRRPSR